MEEAKVVGGGADEAMSNEKKFQPFEAIRVETSRVAISLFKTGVRLLSGHGIGHKNMNLLARAAQILRREGVFCLLRKSYGYVVSRLTDSLVFLYYKNIKSGNFTFRGRTYKYFYHSTTALGETSGPLRYP